MRLRSILAGATALALGLGLPAMLTAQTPGPAPGAGPSSDPAGADSAGQPALVTADQLTLDEALGLVIASGNVELVQGGRIVLADSITYNQRTNVVTAAGNVRLVEPTGDVFFGEYVELTDDLKRVFVDQVRVRLTDDTRIAGAAAERTDGGRFTRVERAVYSPCALCIEDPTRPPSWQIRSSRTTHDAETRDVTHRDAQLEIFGVPLFYTPYLSHPDPTVERRTGLLTPTIGVDSTLGAIVRGYTYFDIQPQTDATLETTWSEEDGLLLGGEVRHRTTNGRVQATGSIVRAERIEERDGQDINRGEQLRFHLFTQGEFHLTDIWRAGFDIQRTSDRGYLRRYDFSSQDLLESRLFLEGFRGRSYAALNAYQFQDLRPGNPGDEPTVLPDLFLSFVGQPDSFLGGRPSLEMGAVAIRRQDGADYNRISFAPGWERSWYMPVGIVATATAIARSDLYITASGDLPSEPGAEDDDEAFRFRPMAQLSMRYPLVGDIGTVQTLVEPIIAITAAPELGGDPTIPNEDSRVVELTDRTLFRLNRFPGVDRVETGSRVTYGLQTGLFGAGGGSAHAFIGQSYRFSGDDRQFTDGSGVADDRSDYVGRVRVEPSPHFAIDYSTAIEAGSLEPRRHSLIATAGVRALNADIEYQFARDVEEAGVSRRDEYLAITLNSQLTDRLSLSLTQARDFSDGGNDVLSTGGILTYEDDCLVVQFIALESNISRSGTEPGATFFVRFVFRGLGEVTSPRVGLGSLFGTGRQISTVGP